MGQYERHVFVCTSGDDCPVQGDVETAKKLTAALRRSILAMPKPLRNVMVAQEVGIAAENGAYRHPWNWGSQTPLTGALLIGSDAPAL